MRIIDGRIVAQQVVDDSITDAKLNSLFQEDNFARIYAAESAITFTTPFAETPAVVTAEGPGLSYARILHKYADSFSWQADIPGSAHWFAWGHRS